MSNLNNQELPSVLEDIYNFYNYDEQAHDYYTESDFSFIKTLCYIKDYFDDDLHGREYEYHLDPVNFISNIKEYLHTRSIKKFRFKKVDGNLIAQLEHLYAIYKKNDLELFDKIKKKISLSDYDNFQTNKDILVEFVELLKNITNTSTNQVYELIVIYPYVDRVNKINMEQLTFLTYLEDSEILRKKYPDIYNGTGKFVLYDNDVLDIIATDGVEFALNSLSDDKPLLNYVISSKKIK